MNRLSPGRLAAVVAAGLVVALGVAACGPAAARQHDSGGRIDVVASTDVWASVVRAVGGKRVAVTTTIDGSSADPHGYRATARDAAQMAEAGLVVYNGGGYDPFMQQLLAATRKERGSQGNRGHTVVAAEASGHGDGNEHVWYDPEAVARVADAVADELSRLRPAAARSFHANAAAFQGKLDRLARRIDAVAAEHAGTRVLSTSPVAHYLLSAAGLRDVAPTEFTEAIEEGTGIPILAQHHVRQLLTGEKVAVMIENSQTLTPVIEKLAEIGGARGIPVVDVRETLPDGSRGYVPWMNGQVQALAQALEAA